FPLFAERLDLIIQIGGEYRETDLSHNIETASLNTGAVSDFSAICPAKLTVKTPVHTEAKTEFLGLDRAYRIRGSLTHDRAAELVLACVYQVVKFQRW